MSKSNKEKIISKLSKGYTPMEITPKQDLSSTFKNIFKPLVNRKDLEFFFDLYKMNNTILKAWSFLGIYHILKERAEIDNDIELKLYPLILDLLNDNNEITYYGGSIETRVPLREHHIRRLAELYKSFIFTPVFEYCKSFDDNPDNVVVELLEYILSKSSDPLIEDLVLHFSDKIRKDDFNKIIHVIKSFENLNENIELQHKKEITELFKRYLKNFTSNNGIDQESLTSKKQLEVLIYKVGALLDLELQDETLNFVNTLKIPYAFLDVIAAKYKNNEKFHSILLRKLNESDNPHFIVEILKAILVIKEKIANWEDLVIKNMMRYQIFDTNLIEGLHQSNLISDNLTVSFLNKGDDWSLKFLREYLIQNPNVLEEWSNLRKALIEILNSFKSPKEDIATYKKENEIKKFILSLIIDLELKDFLKYSLKNFENLEDENLRKMALFPILKFGEESLLLKLKELMKNNHEIAKFVTHFLDRLERNDWRFYY